jgi:transposase
MKTIPLDTRKRILARYDTGRFTRAEVGEQFQVSEGFVKKLLGQRRRLGHAAPLYGNGRAGRRPVMTQERMDVLRAALRETPGLTLARMRDILGGVCSVVCVHLALKRMRVTYKKKRYARPRRTAGARAGHARHCGRRRRRCR